MSFKIFHFKGNIKKLVDDTYSLEGVLSGTMILADDITLEDIIRIIYQLTIDKEDTVCVTRNAIIDKYEEGDY